MKWPRAPADLLCDKTFLVIREDFGPVKGKIPIREDRSCGEEGSKQRFGSLDTWPPKMRKKRPRTGREASCEPDDDEPRPATAVLDAPLVLDPRFINKLDMSLLSKESLSASLIRVSLDKSVVALVDNPRGRAAAEAAPTPTGCEPSRPKIASPQRPTARRRPPAETIAARRADEPASPEPRRLDDNNNNNKNKLLQQQLSPLRSQPSRSAVSSIDAILVSASSVVRKKQQLEAAAPEACRTCGRTVQPERLHSHPRSPPGLSPVKEHQPPAPSRSSVSIIPVRMSGKSARKPTMKTLERKATLSSTASTPRSEQNTSSISSSITVIPESKALSGDETRKEKKESAATSPKSPDGKGIPVPGKRRPTVTCYVCGREFGSLSFPIHEPKCLEKWQRENKALPVSQRRPAPKRPDVPFDSEEWNSVAWEQSQAQLIPCSKCKRTFLPDRLAIHERNCRVSNKVFHRNL